jgi:hypothetical protein
VAGCTSFESAPPQDGATPPGSGAGVPCSAQPFALVRRAQASAPIASFAVDGTSVFALTATELLRADVGRDIATFTPIATALVKPTTVALTQTHVAWAGRLAGEIDGYLFALPRATTTVTAPVPVRKYVGSVVTASVDTVYYSYREGVAKTSVNPNVGFTTLAFKASGAPSALVAAGRIVFVGRKAPADPLSLLVGAEGSSGNDPSLLMSDVNTTIIAADREAAYWVDTAGVLRSAAFAGGAPTTIATGFLGALGLAVDDAFVYVMTQDAVLRTPRDAHCRESFALHASAVAANAAGAFFVSGQEVWSTPP